MIRLTNTESKELNLTKKYRQGWYKPRGLWYGIDREWIAWCKAEMPHWIKKYTFKLEIDESRILVINSPQQLEDFIGKYSHKKIEKIPYWGPQINWQAVTKSYAGIELQNYDRLKPYLMYNEKMFHTWFYGWDVSSGCIWDLSIIKSYSPEKKKRHGKNTNNLRGIA